MYYAVVGTNGVGIYKDYSKLCESVKYIKSAKQKKFKTYAEAEDRIFMEATFPVVCNIPKKFITRKCRLDNINDIIEQELDRKFYGAEISDSFSELTAEEFIAAKLKDMKNDYKFLIFVGSGAVVNGMPEEITTRLKNRIHRSIYLKLCQYKGELGIVSDCFYCDRNYKSREKVMPAALTSILVEYNRDAVINMVNYELNCDFTDIIFVTDNSIDIENNTAALCGNI